MNFHSCQAGDTACWCSLTAILNAPQRSGCSQYAAITHSTILAPPSPHTSHTTVPPATPRLTPPNTTAAAANPASGTSPSLSNATATDVAASVNNNPSSSHTPSSTSIASSDSGNDNASGPLPSNSHRSAIPSSSYSIITGALTASLAASGSIPPSSPLPAGPSITSPPSPAAHQLNTGTIVAITLSALAVVLASTLALFFLFCRRGRRQRSRTSKRASVGSSNSQQHLEPHTYRGRWSRRLSSVWTGFGSVSVIPGIDPSVEDVWRHSNQLSFRLADSEKTEPDAPSPRPSLAPTEARYLVRDVSVHSVYEGVALQATSPSSKLLALAGIDYVAAGPVCHKGRGSEWRRSSVSRVTASSGGVQSVEAM